MTSHATTLTRIAQGSAPAVTADVLRSRPFVAGIATATLMVAMLAPALLTVSGVQVWIFAYIPLVAGVMAALIAWATTLGGTAEGETVVAVAHENARPDASGKGPNAL